METVEAAAVQRYSLWVVFTDRGLVQRGGYEDKRLAIEEAKKYWLTGTGLYRAFVQDKTAGDAIVFDRVFTAHPAPRPKSRF